MKRCMRRNIDEAKAALALRLEEYNVKRRAKRKMAACLSVIVLTASVTAAAVPTLMVTGDEAERGVAGSVSMNKGETNHLVDEQDGITVDGTVDTEKFGSSGGEPNWGADGDGKTNGVEIDITEGVEGTVGSAGNRVPLLLSGKVMKIVQIDRDGNNKKLSMSDAEAVFEALKSLSLEKADKSEEGSVTVQLSITANESFRVSLTANDELIIGGETYTAENIEVFKEALRSAGVIE